MQVSQVQISTIGPSAPIRMLGESAQAGNESIAARYTLQPTVLASISSPGASIHFEITGDVPDAKGNWPSPGNWVAYLDDPAIPSAQPRSSRAFPVKQLFTGIRVVVDGIDVGSTPVVTMQVIQ